MTRVSACFKLAFLYDNVLRSPFARESDRGPRSQGCHVPARETKACRAWCQESEFAERTPILTTPAPSLWRRENPRGGLAPVHPPPRTAAPGTPGGPARRGGE